MATGIIFPLMLVLLDVWFCADRNPASNNAVEIRITATGAVALSASDIPAAIRRLTLRPSQQFPHRPVI
ncbi:hypothetical protein [Rhodococcoides trifolii]|uniref:hypothetical protein n=1 Tax=Rhodococcoides trifolii TaxID=908250 RepID=UPI00166B019D|nr:hypothetical protein [Rhodococcus trifolii]